MPTEFCVGSLPETTRGTSVPVYYNSNFGGVLTYGSGSIAFIRNMKNPAQCDTFTSNEHKGRITVVQMSPNGEWIASGDERGVVLVWGSRPGQHNIKLKVEVNKRVWDLAWSFDSQRIVAVGEGQEQKAKIFDWQSGNQFGAIDGHSQKIISVSFKPTRPFRIATSSEDLAVNYYEGPPFKFSCGTTVCTLDPASFARHF
jgi:WD repeat-containing protein 1 (actin-interacting protein 1)